jgi:hypothetical protein
MNVWLYYASAVLLVPGGLLALYFGAVERAATSTGWGDFFGRFFAVLVWLQGWRLALLIVTLVFLVSAGLVDRLRPWGAGCIFLLALGSMLELWRGSRLSGPNPDQTVALIIWCLGPVLTMVVCGLLLWRELAPRSVAL